jgi:hypothetical protein
VDRGEATLRDIVLAAIEPERREIPDRHIILFIDYGLPSEPLSISCTTGVAGMRSVYYYLASGRPDRKSTVPLVTNLDLTAALSRLEAALDEASKAASASVKPKRPLTAAEFMAQRILAAGRKARGEPEPEE